MEKSQPPLSKFSNSYKQLIRNNDNDEDDVSYCKRYTALRNKHMRKPTRCAQLNVRIRYPMSAEMEKITH
jgi:hypothetical protein